MPTDVLDPQEEDDQVTSDKVILPPGSLDRGLRMPGSVSREPRQWRRPVQPVSTAPRRGCRGQPLPAGPQAALEEGDNERGADPSKPGGGAA